MSTVLIEGPYRFFWYSADRTERPHVHVERDKATAKFWFDTIELVKSNRFKKRELRRIQAIVEANRGAWLVRWRLEFGE